LVRIANENILKANVNEQATYEIDEIIVPPKSYKAMTLTEFTVYANKAEELYNEARGRSVIIIDGVTHDRKEFTQELKDGIDQNATTKKRERTLEEESFKTLKDAFKAMDAMHTKLEFLFKQFDGNTEGIWWKTFMPTMQHADNLRGVMMEDYGNRMNEVLEPIAETLSNKVVAPNGQTITREKIVMMALNTGNLDSKQKLYDGTAKANWSESDINWALEQLTEAEWQAVQGTWDVVNSLWPDIVKEERKRTGYAPEKVEASPVKTRFGTLTGGYFPLSYNGEFEVTAAKNDDAKKLKELSNNRATRASTRKGHVEARRKGVKMELNLSMAVIDMHITQVIQDIAYDEVTRELSKLINDKTIAQSIIERFGQDKYKLINQWLVDVARGDYTTAGIEQKFAKMADALRRNTTVFAMAYKMTTMAVQPLGIAQSIQNLGPGVALKMMANPISILKNRAIVFGKSEFMRQRGANFDRDVRDTLNKIKAKSKGGLVSLDNRIEMFSFRGVSEMDLLVSIPTWQYAYDMYIESGFSEKDAVDFADGQVRQTQGHGAMKDLAAIQRSSSWLRLASMFYMYFSSYYNMQAEAIRKTGALINDGEIFEATVYAFRSYILLTAIPALLAETMLGRGPDEDEDNKLWWYGKRLLSYPFMGIVLARDVANWAVSGYSYRATPVEQAVENIGKAALEIPEAIEEGGMDWNDFKQVLKGMGYLTGKPWLSAQAIILYNNIMKGLTDRELEPVEMLMIKEAKD